MRVVRGAPTVLLAASSEASSRSQGKPCACFAGWAGSAFLSRKRSSIKCLVRMSAVYIRCPQTSCTAGLGHLSLSSILVPIKGFNCSLRRCTCAGHHRSCSAKPFVQGRTGIKRVAGTMRSAHSAFSQLWVCRLTNRCSEPGTIKCLAAGVDLPASSQLPRARVLTRQLAVAELNR